MKQACMIMLLLVTVACAAFASGEPEESGFSYPDIESVEVRASSLDVDMRLADGFSVSMTADLPQDSFFESRGYVVKHEVDGSRLIVWVERDGGLFSDERGGKLAFHVPRGTRIRIETVSGSIHAAGIESSDMRMRSVSGSVVLDGLRGSLEVSCVSGGVIIDGFEGRVRAKSVSGSIQGRDILLTQDAEFSSTSGSIDVRLENRSEGLRFDLSSISGRIKVGTIRAEKGLRMGEGQLLVRGETVSGSQIYR